MSFWGPLEPLGPSGLISSPGSPQSLGSTSPRVSHNLKLFCNIAPPLALPPQSLHSICVALSTSLHLSDSPFLSPLCWHLLPSQGKYRHGLLSDPVPVLTASASTPGLGSQDSVLQAVVHLVWATVCGAQQRLLGITKG